MSHRSSLARVSTAGTAGLIATLMPILALAAGRPPDLVATVNGEVRVRARHGISAGSHHMYFQVDRAGNGPGWDEDYDLGILAGTNPDIHTGVTVQVGDRLNVKTASTEGGLTLSYVADRDPRPGESQARIVDHDLRGTVRSCGGGIEGPVDVTDLYTSSVHLMSLSCWEGWYDWDFNDFVVAVDYTPESVPTSTPSPTSSPTATDTPTATPTPPPTATPTPVPASSCVCAVVRSRAPAAVIADALANPDRYYGWMYPLDPGKPPSPANPPRTCLSLHQIALDYHPLWNTPEWRSGCP